MASKSLWAIVDYLRENQTVTPRQVQALLGCDCKKSHNLLLHLIRRSVVLRTGEPHHPVFTLLPGGESNIKRPKQAMRPAPASKQSRQRKQCNQLQQGRPLWTFAARTGRATKFIKFLGVHGHE